jgi:hypothetical protein
MSCPSRREFNDRHFCLMCRGSLCNGNRLIKDVLTLLEPINHHSQKCSRVGARRMMTDDSERSERCDFCSTRQFPIFFSTGLIKIVNLSHVSKEMDTQSSTGSPGPGKVHSSSILQYLPLSIKPLRLLPSN